ncbi:hypothetical protein JCM6882_006845 [Rhodosporidiobolus microsporus]
MRLSKNTPQAAFLVGAGVYTASSAFAQNTSSSDKWTLSTTDFLRDAWQTQPYVANGYIGQRIPAEGFGYREFTPVNQTAHNETQGWPLFTPRQAAAIVAGFYDQQPETEGTNFAQTGGQQPLATLPTWSSLYLTVNNETYSIQTPDNEISNWTQSMSIQDGVVETSLNWTPAGMTDPISLTYTILAHRVLPNVGAVRMTARGLPENASVAVTDVFDGAGAWRTDFVSSGPVENSTNTLHTAVRPYGVPNVTAYEVSVLNLLSSSISTVNAAGADCLSGGEGGVSVLSTNQSTASQCYRLVSVPSSGEIDAIKYVGIASSDAYPGKELETALSAAQNANSTGFDELLKTHKEAWDGVWDAADIEIPGEDFEELQMATRASLFHMLANVRNGSEPTGLGDNSIAPAGLTSDSYAGQIFWDADTWMYPGLLALFPDYAESVIDFRYRQLGAAMENAAEYNLSGALYPWTGARYGNDTGAGPAYDYEYHLNSDIALAAWQYYAVTGNQTWLEEKGWPLVKNVADMIASFVVYNETTGRYDTYNMTSPDEYSNHKNNSAMTNGAFTVTLMQAMQLAPLVNFTVPSNWTIIEQNITMIEQNGILMEFEGINGTTEIKQADVTLLAYPFEYPERSDTGFLQDLDYYSAATSPSGPGMTYSQYSIVAAELSPVGCASWSYFIQSAQPYSRAPYYQFSEQTTDLYVENGGTNPAFTFLTGHGGFLQTLTHGFTGYRFRLDRLFFDPNLPPQFSNYTVKGLHYQGASFDINVSTNETVITRRSGGGNETVAVEISSRNEKGGNYTLAAGESLTVRTRSTSGTLIENNVAQCAPVLFSNDTMFHIPANSSQVVPGEYGMAALDGANATTWQPLTPDPASLVVDLGSEKAIRGLHFNWGPEPPTAWSVSVSNSSGSFDPTAEVSLFPLLLAQGNITQSDLTILSAEEANIVRLHVGNLTDVQLQNETVARYVELTIEGAWTGEGQGGTVAEFAVIGA